MLTHTLVSFSYDADGNLVKQVDPDGVVTLYVGPHYEVQPGAGSGGQDIITRYYQANGQRVAMRRSGDPDTERNGRFTTHADHLNSTSLVMDASGQVVDELR